MSGSMCPNSKYLHLTVPNYGLREGQQFLLPGTWTGLEERGLSYLKT